MLYFSMYQVVVTEIKNYRNSAEKRKPKKNNAQPEIELEVLKIKMKGRNYHFEKVTKAKAFNFKV